MKSPEEIYGELFVAVQESRVFGDSKTFVDCVPERQPEEIVREYHARRDDNGFDLGQFVESNFSTPGSSNVAVDRSSSRTIEEHIAYLWDILQRSADEQHTDGSSLIPLQHPYVVPGGRFGEVYYWDSYFTMLGLLTSGKTELVKNVLDNFAALIDQFGYIPNGNRSYFLSRSQPPLFPLMVQLLANYTAEPKVLIDYRPAMEKEYAFWMTHEGRGPHRRAVPLEDTIVNRYWDDRATPRSESYIEDIELGIASDRDEAELFRDIRAACESGWDFSSRWLVDPYDLTTISTTRILPVDLNCILYLNERIIAESYGIGSNHAEEEFWTMRAERRRSVLHVRFWNRRKYLYTDYHIDGRKPMNNVTMASFFPFYAGIISPRHAKQSVKVLEQELLKPGGWMTTNVRSGQQWDAPNGWAPLQWIAYKGLMNAGFEELAREGANRWLENCERVFSNTGKLVEKYNVQDISLEAGGGEYPLQDGFGWTNGVYLALQSELETS